MFLLEQLTAVGGQLTQSLDRSGPVGHGSFKMRYAAHHINAQVQGPLEVRSAAGVAQIAILGKGHQLQIDKGFDFFTHRQQSLYRQQPIVTDVHVTANGQGAARHGPVTELNRTGFNVFSREMRL